MNTQLHILVADRNPHVRRFFKRELEAEGYRVQLVENAPEVLRQVFGPQPPDLLILDPELPGSDAGDLLNRRLCRCCCTRFWPIPLCLQ